MAEPPRESRGVEQQEDIVVLASRLTSKLSRLHGVSYIVVVNEGFPLDYKGDIPRERAESAAAAAVDLEFAGDIYLKDLTGEEWERIIAVTKKGAAVGVSRARSLLFLAYGDKAVIERIVKTAAEYVEGKRHHCYNCGFDLTLEPYTCPNCGNTILFTEPRCPVCGYDVSVKSCPNCGVDVTSTGEKPAEAKLARPVEVAAPAASQAPVRAESEEQAEAAAPASPAGFIAVEGLIGGAIAGGLTFLLTQSPPLSLVAAVLGLLAGSYIAFRLGGRSGGGRG